jgi:hypothetical protein
MAATLYYLVAARAEHRCEFCQAPEAVFNQRFSIDHIIPRALGGSDTFDNLALACDACNGHKYKKQMAVDKARKKPVRLFNPRRDKWERHFYWNSTKTQIIGRTAIGRATINALKLNCKRQIVARALWQKIGKFSG